MNDNPAPQPVDLLAAVQYNDDAIVSKTLLEAPTGMITLFAFDAGQALSEHTTPFDAVVQILDGAAVITIGGNAVTVATGQQITMPADIPHALKAVQRFKMLLTMMRK